MSSRLFNEVREKRGLAYEIGTLTKRYYDTGAFIVHAGIDNKKVFKAIELILRELKKIKDSLVLQDEFKRAKEFYIGQLKLGLEDTLEQMLWIGETTATLDKVYSLKQILNEVNSISRQDLRAIAREIFNQNNLSLSLIGPLRAIEDKLYKQLHIG